MTRPTLGIRIPPCQPVSQLAEFAAEVERQRFDDIYVPDSQLLWRDPFMTLHAIAQSTSSVGLCTAVSNVVTRHPSVVASAARTIAEEAPGRFRLGLGVGHSSVEPVGLRSAKREDFRTGVAQIRDLLDGKDVQYGEVTGRLRDPQPDVPILMAATGPRNLRLAGEIADGAILLSGVSTSLLERGIGLVRQGAEESGRNPAELKMVVSAHAMVTDDIERDARILKPICAGIAQQGASAGLAAAGINVQVPAHVSGIYPDLVHAEDWDLAVGRCSEWISDADAVRFAEEFCLFGTAEQIVDRILEAQRFGVTSIFFQHVGSYHLPEQLVADVANSVLPLLDSAGA